MDFLGGLPSHIILFFSVPKKFLLSGHLSVYSPPTLLLSLVICSLIENKICLLNLDHFHCLVQGRKIAGYVHLDNLKLEPYVCSNNNVKMYSLQFLTYNSHIHKTL